MLSNTLNTNEIKDAAGTKVDFERDSFSTSGTGTLFRKTGEAYALPFRFSVNHREVGAGINRKRESVIRFSKTAVSDVDNSTPVATEAYTVLRNPIGARLTQDEAKAVLAALLSFLASDGTNTTVKYDGTGTGAKVLLNGTL